MTFQAHPDAAPAPATLLEAVNLLILGPTDQRSSNLKPTPEVLRPNLEVLTLTCTYTGYRVTGLQVVPRSLVAPQRGAGGSRFKTFLLGGKPWKPSFRLFGVF